MSDPNIESLKRKVRAAQQEFDLAVMFHEVWKPSAYDTSIHDRMGTSYATNAFHVVRFALRREMLLALMRLWDKRQNALSVESIVALVKKQSVIDALVKERFSRIGIAGAENAIRESLTSHVDTAVKIVRRYARGGSHYCIRENLQTYRHKKLAHRNVDSASSVERVTGDEEIETFYRDNSKLVQSLLSLVHAEAYDPMSTADVYKHHASLFWESVRGERTKGHPRYRNTGILP